ncbi:helix-turn-helix transcriptional regulator [Streptomyces sp. AK04-3B]|uniref:helix-turn-helix domain-containing protein n=1 Tax=Streptomyces sp. AK04-3B TaxID=3028650 RepID=UPI0029BD9034|nr:helix-turn-helix transcriptional regulator [Streptomyces sp. AK04-3B]MDX3801083.1 helix-turn-helix transcriptional regulator [Streptomyces sp. AK04-3B]
MTRSPADSVPQRPFADLAQHLIALRRAARLPQRGLAEAANVSRGAVQRAESGTAAPTEAVLDAYLRACRAGESDRARARLLRTRGRAAQRDKLHELKAPAPDFITTKRDLALALAEVYERAGAPSLNGARLRKLLPRTTAWRIVNRKGLPASAEQLVTFLSVCGISRPAAQRPYLDAYRHVIAQRGTRPLPPRAQRIGRGHRGPRARGATNTIPLIDYSALAPVLMTLAEVAPRIDVTAAAPTFTALTDAVPRIDFSAAGPVLTALAENMAAAGRLVDREAHRNGTAAPDWTTALSHISTEFNRALAGSAFTMGTDDRGNALVTRTGDGGAAVIQSKSHRDRPAPPPARPAPAVRAC